MDDSSLARQAYEHYYDMLSDQIRMQAYREAIFSTVKHDDVVVDLGAGTGLLSIWAIKAGASKVYAIEKTDAIELAKEIARANNCENKIEFIKQNSADVVLSEKADVLISETLGSFGVDENTLQFAIDARDRFLKNSGVMLPQSVKIFSAPVEDSRVYNKLDFWRHIPDVDFSPAFNLFSKKIMVEAVDAGNVLSEKAALTEIDLQTTREVGFTAQKYLQINKPGWIHGVAGWFVVKLCEGITINTAPDQPLTHWKQAFFPFEKPVEVIKGDVLDWQIKVVAKEKNSDDTSIQYEYRCTQLKNEMLKQNSLKNIARNDKCPCGSGKKFKKCCMTD